MLKMPEKIKSEHIILTRPFPVTFELANEIFEKIDSSRNTLRQWLSHIDLTKKPEDRFPWLMNQIQKWENGENFAYIIRDKKTHTLLGGIDLMHCNGEDKAAEIGYWLSNDAVGHGYVTEAVNILETTAFEKGFNRIIIRNDTQNVRSDNVPKRCGYHLEGTMRSLKWSEYWKSFRDINIWSKLKSEWKNKQKKKT